MKTQSKALEFIYQDTQIHFLLGNEKEVMVNATEMAKAFGKEIKDFMRLDSTKNFINSFLKMKNRELKTEDSPFLEDKIYTSKQKSGTYMIRPFALKFAAWLDSDFEVWCFKTIDEILFGNAKKVGEKISDAELKKQKIAKLIQEVRNSGDVTAISLLDNLEELKVIEKEKKKAMMLFSNQFKIEFN